MLGAYSPIAFIGSGLSTNFPGWQKFIESLADFVGNRIGTKFLREISGSAGDVDVLLAIADECAANEGRVEEFMRRHFLNEHKRARRPPIFDSLVRAPFAYYITTNYDTNLEDAYLEQFGVELEVATFHNIEKVFSLILENRPFLLKLHGCAKSGGRFVIGYRDYQKIIYGNPRVRAILEVVLGSRPVVFMGYGHRDPHISAYLDLQRQRLQDRSLPKFTYIKVDVHPFDIAEYYADRYFIESVQVNDWSELKTDMDQFAYLQMRDRYERIRKNKFRLFQDFLDTANPRRAWDALLYAAASSELGITTEVERLWSAVRDGARHSQIIVDEPALELIFRTISGQMMKRKLRTDAAAQEFDRATRLAKTYRGLLPPLRALALRYAGIFELAQGHSRLALQLLREAQKILEGDEFEEELLDVRKWLALYRARVRGEHAAAARELRELAGQAEDLGYAKNAAWCYYNAGAEALRGAKGAAAAEALDDVRRALTAFEELDHLRGRAQCHLLLCEISDRRTGGEFERHLRLGRAAATLAEDDRLQQRFYALERS